LASRRASSRRGPGVTGPVDLDDEAPVRPVEVDLFVEQVGVDQRALEVPVDQAQEGVLRVAARAGAAAQVQLDGRAQPREVAPAVRARQRVARAGAVEEATERGSWMTFAS
jgi:hypothetical protein